MPITLACTARQCGEHQLLPAVSRHATHQTSQSRRKHSLAAVDLRQIASGSSSAGPTPTPTRMRLSCNFVNVYTIACRVQHTFTRVRARISNGQPREDPREEKRAARVSVESANKSARIVVRVRLVASRTRRTRRLPRR